MTARPLRLLTTLLVAALVAGCGPTAHASPSRPGLPATASGSSARTSGLEPTHPAVESSSTCAEAAFESMTEAQRVGQLFMLGIDHDTLAPAEIVAIGTYHIGSAFLVNNRTNGVGGIRALAEAIQAVAPGSAVGRVGMFVAADQEGGLVQRLNGPGFSTIPAATEQGQLPVETLRTDAMTWGRELAAAGINVNLAPVMDVVPSGADTANKPIGALGREFGHDQTTVGDHGTAVVRGMQAAGVATTLKHFPGLGRVAGNTDTAAGVIDSVTTADDPFLASFRAGIDAGAPMVMVSLATYTAIDPDHPAVFSQQIVEGLLRGSLGFGGVVVSDDLGAAASVASIPAADRAVRFIAAGGDLVVVEGTASAGAMAAAVSAEDASDAGFAGRVNAAALRVLEAKAAYGLLTCRPV